MLGAARIGAPGLIIPARSHPEVVVHAVAARDLARAQAYAKKHGIKKAYEGYQGIDLPDCLFCVNAEEGGGFTALLDDPEVDVVYNAVRLSCSVRQFDY